MRTEYLWKLCTLPQAPLFRHDVSRCGLSNMQTCMLTCIQCRAHICFESLTLLFVCALSRCAVYSTCLSCTPQRNGVEALITAIDYFMTAGREREREREWNGWQLKNSVKYSLNNQARQTYNLNEPTRKKSTNESANNVIVR